MFVRTTATYKIFNLKQRIRGVSGGTSASKTISILLWIIQRAGTNPEDQKETISVVSESMPHLKRGAIRDFLSIMQEHNAFDGSRWNKTDYIYTFPNGSIIEFFSADQPGKVRGPRRDILFINEANNISYDTFTQLEVRTKKIIWLDWNPVSEFWFYTDLRGQRDDVDFLTLTYKDNEALDEAIIRTIEARQSNKSWWRVYGEGLLGEAEGRVYNDWNLEIDEIPYEARLERYGLDFGYSNDPTTIIAVYRYNGAFILDEICYQIGMSNREIADTLKNLPKGLVIADSAEPKSIDEIRGYGVNIIGANKGPGSVSHGIQYVQDQKISVTKRSTNIIKEYRNYLWITDKDGKIINEPQGFLNHTMDALRYGLESFKPKKFQIPTEFGGVPWDWYGKVG